MYRHWQGLRTVPERRRLRRSRSLHRVELYWGTLVRRFQRDLYVRCASVQRRSATSRPARRFRVRRDLLETARRRRSHQRRKEGNAPNRMVVVGGSLLTKEFLRMILKSRLKSFTALALCAVTVPL